MRLLSFYGFTDTINQSCAGRGDKRRRRALAKLTDKQDAFCREYIVDLNATQAAIRAGYSEKTATKIASENLTKPDIQAVISQLVDARNKRVDINADWVLISAKRVFDRCMQDEAVTDRNGDQVMCKTEAGDLAAAYQFNANGANKALETIGKHVSVKAFEKDTDTTGSDKLVEVLSSLIGSMPS